MQSKSKTPVEDPHQSKSPPHPGDPPLAVAVAEPEVAVVAAAEQHPVDLASPLLVTHPVVHHSLNLKTSNHRPHSIANHSVQLQLPLIPPFCEIKITIWKNKIKKAGREKKQYVPHIYITPKDVMKKTNLQTAVAVVTNVELLDSTSSISKSPSGTTLKLNYFTFFN